jgi:cell wall-associated NlpC family hydrolase
MITEVTLTASAQRLARRKQVTVKSRPFQLLAITGMVPLAIAATALPAHAASHTHIPPALQLMRATRNTMRLSWPASPGATSYSYQLYQMNGVRVRSGREPGAVRTVMYRGLHPGWKYRADVSANPGDGRHETLTVALPGLSPVREIAYQWAETKAGARYRYGAQGDGGYDCSGLVRAAYRHAGIWLPRTTGEMLQDRLLQQVSAPHQGDLVFFGTDHVELYAGHDRSFGAEDNPTGIWWNRWWPGSWWPTAFYHVSSVSSAY